MSLENDKFNQGQLVGIAGPARCGKDTVADILIKTLTGYKKASFADPIKEMILSGLGLRTNQVYGDDKDTLDERYGCTPRHMMQTLGTEWGRMTINNDIWVKAMETRLRPGMIIPDVRFENEAVFVRKHGVLIHIVGRGGIEGDHVSESGIKAESDDIAILNNGSIEQLERSIKDFIL